MLARNWTNRSENRKIDHTKLNLASHHSTEVKARGTVRLITAHEDENQVIRLDNTLHVPDLRNNLISVSKITDVGYQVVFDKSQVKILDKNKNPLVTGERIGDLYYLQEARSEVCALSTSKGEKLKTWHERFGHLNKADLLKMAKQECVLTLDVGSYNQLAPCETCLKGKLTALPFPKKSDRSTKLLELIHMDIWGPARTESRGKARYFLTFIDDYSRWCEVRFLSNKEQPFQAFKEFKNLIKKQTGEVIKSIQSDNGGEFINTEFDNFLKAGGRWWKWGGV